MLFMAASVFGSDQIKRTLKHMRGTAKRRAMMQGFRKVGQAMVKRIKADIPSRYKTIRKAIRWRALKVKESPEAGVKVGAGMKTKVSTIVRGDKPGVGIASRNVHWWYLGTDERAQGIRRKTRGRVVNRQTGNTIRRTGRMKKQQRGVTWVVRQSEAEIMDIMKQQVWDGIKKEVKKGKAF